MKKVVNSFISFISSHFYRLALPRQDKTYWIIPKIPYISQFVGIKPQNLHPEDQLNNIKEIQEFGAKNAKEFTFWAWRDCGIACVLMILKSRGKAKNITMMDLTKEGIKLGGYILYEGKTFVDKGWFHQSLIDLLSQHEIKARMKKWQSAESVALDIVKNKQVILSMLLPGRRNIKNDGSFEALDPQKLPSGHLVVATGVKIGKQGTVEGIFVHDPRGLTNYQKNTYIPITIFNRIFTNRTIVIS